MNRQRLHSALARATTSTFEELALLVVVGVVPADASDASDARAARRPPCGVRVDFAGPWAGSLVVRAAEAVLDAAAANMLGIPAAPDAAARCDALGELANVVCGNVLPEVAGRAPVFALQAPRWIGAADAACAATEVRVVCLAELDGGHVAVELHVPAHLVTDATTPAGAVA